MSHTTLAQETTMTDEIVFCCHKCETPIILNSREHDHCICDDDGEIWWCEDCAPTMDHEDDDEMEEKVAKIQRWWRGIDVAELKMDLLGLEVGKVVTERQLRALTEIFAEAERQRSEDGPKFRAQQAIFAEAERQRSDL